MATEEWGTLGLAGDRLAERAGREWIFTFTQDAPRIRLGGKP